MKEMNDKERARYRLDWQNLKQDWPIWVVMAGLLTAAFFIYPHLPEQVPSHWNIRGEVDAYSSREFGAFFAPLLVVALYALMLVLPLLDPRRDNYLRFSGTYRLLRWAIVLFMSGLYGTTILASFGYAVDVGLVVKAGVALLFILVGNFMGQFRHNYFVGIRTPWTLADEGVWQKTHRLGGRVWVAGGILGLVLAPVKEGWGACLLMVVFLAMVLIPIVYSYFVFKRADRMGA